MRVRSRGAPRDQAHAHQGRSSFVKISKYTSMSGVLSLALMVGSGLACLDVAAQTAATETYVVNPHSPANGHPYRHGVVPTLEAHAAMQAWRALNEGAVTAATGVQTLSYGGGFGSAGVTSGTPKVYLVIYGNQWGSAGTDANGNMTLSNDPVGAVPYLQNMFKGLGTGGELWSGVMTQYCDGGSVAAGATSCPPGAPLVGFPNGATLAGVWYDNSVAAPAQATAAQLAQEAVNAAAHFGNTASGSNRYVQYVILSPTTTHPDGFNTPNANFCAWHNATTSVYGSLAYTNMPYVYDMLGSCGAYYVNGGAQGALDGFSIVEGHEYAETLTDQFPSTGWVNRTGSSYNGQENADECAWIRSGQGAIANVAMATGAFAMQSTWSNDTNRCDLSHSNVGGGAAYATLTPNPVDFGTVYYQSGGSSTAVATFTNISGATLAFTQPSAGSVSGAAFTFVSTTCGTSLASGGTCTVTMRFVPTQTGTNSGLLGVATAYGISSTRLTGVGRPRPR